MKKFGLVSVLVFVSLAGGVSADGPSITRSNFQSVLDQCNVGDGDSCQALGDVFRSEDDAGAIGQRVNLDLSLQFYERGCALGDSGACGSVNRIYGDKDYSGYDPARALPYFEERCARRGEGSSDCRKVVRLRADL